MICRNKHQAKASVKNTHQVHKKTLSSAIENIVSQALKRASLMSAACRYISVLSLSAVTSAGAFASEGHALKGTATVIPGSAKLIGTVSLDALLAVPKFLRADANVQHKEMHKHRLPNGKFTTDPSVRSLIEQLPSLAPNASIASNKTATSATPGFMGIVSADNISLYGYDIEPPDQGLAVHNNVVAEIVNDVVEFFDATTGASLAPAVSLLALFGENSQGDGQVFFDPTIDNGDGNPAGRWFFTAIDSSGTGFDMAVSQTADPLGSYYQYDIIPTIPEGNPLSGDCSDVIGIVVPSGQNTCLLDYPKGGYDANAFFISANMYNGDSFVSAATFAISKANLIVNSTPTVALINYPAGEDGPSFTVQPSVPAPGQAFEMANSGTEFLMESRYVTDGTSSVTVWAIGNTASIDSTPDLTVSGYNLPVETYGNTVPATQPNVINPMCSDQGGVAAPLLDGVFSSFQSTIQYAGNQLYGVLPFGAVDGNGYARDVLAWFVVNPAVPVTDSTIANQGYVVPPNGYSLLNPAFGLNNTGDGLLGFSITNPNQSLRGGFPSAGVIQMSGGAPVFPAGGTFPQIYVTGVGQSSDQGFTGCYSGNVGAVGRWGDYGAATVDSATGLFYAANEYIPGAASWGGGSNWGTYITQSPTPMP
jgi:hypothetical protein